MPHASKVFKEETAYHTVPVGYESCIEPFHNLEINRSTHRPFIQEYIIGLEATDT
jgi:hypothetical protein